MKTHHFKKKNLNWKKTKIKSEHMSTTQTNVTLNNNTKEAIENLQTSLNNIHINLKINESELSSKEKLELELLKTILPPFQPYENDHL